MALEGTYEQSAWDAIADQVRRFEETEGREANALNGKPVIILWTRGRHTGNIRKTPLMRVRDGDRYAVVASLGGAPKNPVWYHNIVADPHVSLQDGAELKDYVAHQATGEEKKEWWAKATEVWPDYDLYQARTDREIPLIVLDPVT